MMFKTTEICSFSQGDIWSPVAITSGKHQVTLQRVRLFKGSFHTWKSHPSLIFFHVVYIWLVCWQRASDVSWFPSLFLMALWPLYSHCIFFQAPLLSCLRVSSPKTTEKSLKGSVVLSTYNFGSGQTKISESLDQMSQVWRHPNNEEDNSHDLTLLHHIIKLLHCFDCFDWENPRSRNYIQLIQLCSAEIQHDPVTCPWPGGCNKKQVWKGIMK